LKLSTEHFGVENEVIIYMIHGWGLCSKVFYSIVPILSKEYHIALIDLAGYGLNNKIPANRCDGIIESLEQTIVDNSVIFGWSLGGILALKYTILHKSNVRGLITCSSSPRFTSDINTNWPGTDSKILQKFSKILTADNCQTVINKFLSLQAMGSNSMKQDIRMLKQFLNKAESPSYYELQSGLKTLLDEDLRNYTSRIECPSLHLYGLNDRLTPASTANIWPNKNNTKCHIFTQSSHAPFISEPSEFSKVILDFMHKYY
jgi:pimeloyl-[acyl-carrier protein] methyl ester esterase